MSSKPLLLAPDVLPSAPPEAPAPISDIQDIPLLLSRAEIRLGQTQQYVHGDCLQLGPWTGEHLIPDFKHLFNDQQKQPITQPVTEKKKKAAEELGLHLQSTLKGE